MNMNVQYDIYEHYFHCFNGKKLLFDLRENTVDFNTVQSTMVNDEYGLKDFVIKGGDIVIDLGSYIGGEAVYFGSIDNNVKVYSYEPLPENFELLKKNVDNNNCSGVKIFPLAVGSERKKIKMYYGSRETTVHRFIAKHLTIECMDEYAEVEMITLEDIFKENNISHCKLLRMDIEGSEVGMFEKCPENILKNIDWIVGEHHNLTRKELLNTTKGLFEDVLCLHQTDSVSGHFRFKNIGA